MTSAPTKQLAVISEEDINKYKSRRNSICKCRRCDKDFKKNDMIIRVRSSRVQWYHSECYKEY